MAIMGEYPTAAGKALGGIIWNNMIDNFGTGKTEFDDSTIKCVDNSKNETLSSRRENYIAYCSVRDGIKEYMTGYSKIELTTVGSAVGNVSNIRVNITEDDNIKLTGFLDFNPDTLFSIYATPNVHNLYGVDLASDGYLKSLSNFFDIIVSWLSFPMVDINSSGMGNGIYVTGKGNIKFGTNDDISADDKKAEIFAEYKDKLTKIAQDVKDHFDSTGKALDGVFNMYWDIIASGIVDYVNTNEIISSDVGVGVLTYNAGGAPLVENATYTGMSSGVCTFGSVMVPKISLTLPSIEPIGSLSFNINIDDVPEMECQIVEVIDKYGVKKEICAKIESPTVTGTLSTISGNVKDALNNSVSKVSTFINKIMTRLGYATEAIATAIGKVVAALTKAVTTVLGVIIKGITAFLEVIAKQIVIPVVRGLRAALWEPLMKVTQLAAYYTVKTLMNIITAVTDFISKVMGAMIKLIAKLAELISYVVGSVSAIITKIIEFFSNLGNKDDDVSECDEFRSMVSLLSNAPIPTVPDAPEEPEVPDAGDSKCLNPNFDPNDSKSVYCIPCSTCPDCEPCPPTNDDGDDISNQIPAKVPSDPVDDTDPLYEGAMATVKNVLVLS